MGIPRQNRRMQNRSSGISSQQGAPDREDSAGVTGISSMATRFVLGDLADAFRQQSGTPVYFESVGGVDAARRVAAGEVFDLVVLAADAIDRLIATGHVIADSRADLVRSPVAIAIGAGAAHPDISSERALYEAVLAARSIGYSTGPSGTELLKLFARWNIAEAVRDRIVQAPPGMPVARLLADGRIDLGFQQYSEMMAAPGVDVLGVMPPECAIVSTFTAGLCASSQRPEITRALIDFMQSPAATEAKRRQGMDAA